MNRALLRQRDLRAEFVFLRKLGEGTFGVVYQARPAGHEDAPFVALKVLKLHREADAEVCTSLSTLREIKLLQEFNHPNVVALKDVVIAEKLRLALVFEYGACGIGTSVAATITGVAPIRRSGFRSEAHHSAPQGTHQQRVHDAEHDLPDPQGPSLRAGLLACLPHLSAGCPLPP